MLNHSQSTKHFLEASRYLAAGVGSDARLVQGRDPVCLESGYGSRVVDVDGNEYIDYILSIGPLVLGHCPRPIIEAVSAQLERGTMFGAAAVGEEALARMVCEMLPSADLVSFTNSATEAVHMALRLARAFTGKTRILKFEGAYHGWIDDVFVSVHPPTSGLNARGHCPQAVPEGPGQTPASSSVDVAVWNSIESVEQVLRRKGQEIAAIILEPILATNGVIPPDDGFLAALLELGKQYECLVIFDETVTAFRMAPGSAQAYYGAVPDLTVFGKALGGGYPIAGFGGSREVMSQIVNREVGRAGTYNSNSLCVAAATAVLLELQRDGGAAFRDMTLLGKALTDGLEAVFATESVPLQIQGPGPFFSAFFADQPIRNYRDVFKIDHDAATSFSLALLEEGIRVWPAGRGLWFMSTAHTQEDVNLTLERAELALRAIKKKISKPTKQLR